MFNFCCLNIQSEWSDRIWKGIFDNPTIEDVTSWINICTRNVTHMHRAVQNEFFNSLFLSLQFLLFLLKCWYARHCFPPVFLLVFLARCLSMFLKRDRKKVFIIIWQKRNHYTFAQWIPFATCWIVFVLISTLWQVCVPVFSLSQLWKGWGSFSLL